VEPALDTLARKYVWWLAGEPRRELLLCQLMQLGTYEDVRHARGLLGDEAFRDALRRAPPGVLDARSWNFWHRLLGIDPIPPMPTRPLPWTPSNRS
jgi:hypothetical protein